MSFPWVNPLKQRLLFYAVTFLGVSISAAVAQPSEVVWQWSVPVGEGRAYLWIPEKCERVRAVLLAQHNMIEKGILEHPIMRTTLADLGIAEVFIVPSADVVFHFDQGASERFDRILQSLADESGYSELATAPVVPLGHSAHASFPWNFAAANPGRTLAVLSVKGDAPLTDLTGSGRPNPEWGDRTLDGIPGLMVMSEYEWWEARLAPLLKYRRAHPAAPLALYADVGHGHFDATDSLVEFLALFIRKSANARLPEVRRIPDPPSNHSEVRSGNLRHEKASTLRAVDPRDGWLIDRWRGDELPHAPPAPFTDYAGERPESFWCFDQEMAHTIDAHYATGRGKQAQQVSFRQQNGWVPVSNSHAGIELTYSPEADGLTVRLEAGFITPLPPKPPMATKDKRPPPTTIVPKPAPTGTHAMGDVNISAIIGPVAEVSPGTFRIVLDRMFSMTDPRTSEAWFFAHHPGDAIYKSTVQQALLHVPRYSEGAEQSIAFPQIIDQPAGVTMVTLAAKSDCGLPVSYFVRDGPAVVRAGVLHVTPLPPRAKLPVKITVVAWQLGRGTEPKVKMAAPVERSFYLLSP